MNPDIPQVLGVVLAKVGEDAKVNSILKTWKLYEQTISRILDSLKVLPARIISHLSGLVIMFTEMSLLGWRHP